MRISLRSHTERRKKDGKNLTMWKEEPSKKLPSYSPLPSCWDGFLVEFLSTASIWSSSSSSSSPSSLSAFPSCPCSMARFSASFPCWMSNWGTESLHKALTPRVKEKRSCEKRKGERKKARGKNGGWEVAVWKGRKKKRGATREEICKKSREWGTDKEQGRRILRRGSTQKGERGWLVKVGSKETKPEWR